MPRRRYKSEEIFAKLRLRQIGVERGDLFIGGGRSSAVLRAIR
jgi:hypothetical protein